jgi:hydrogenase-4 component E
MINVLLITFAISLLYLSIVNRLVSYLKILAAQGLILFSLSFIELDEMNTVNLIFIVLETIIFKTIAVPLFLNYIMKRNKITREAEPYVSNFFSLVIVTAILIITFLISQMLVVEGLNKIYFMVALSSLFTGLYLIITRRKIITHVMGFMVIENGVFILSLTVGNEMPMLVNTGILLDFFVSFLVLGIFMNKIGDVFKEPDVDKLNQIRD